MNNPFLIQQGPKGHIPLFLIHDGGGTIFHYCLLKKLNRVVWGIHNPHFNKDEKWTGGVPEMAKLYTMMLKSVITSGDVIIGGWSLGGCIALEMAHLLQGHTHIHIKGLIMIDSIYPKFRPDALESETYHLEFLNTVPEHIRRSVQRCVDQAIYMLSRWQGPDWSERDIHDGSANCLFKTTGPPPTILIRATEALPSTWKPLDASPEEKLLRWDIYRENPFIRILDVPGHHFSMFESYNITKITDALQYACDVLEKL